eukprot:CAMPEP_0185726722 /NCGR_PEP_ID=MMETSP1171-20130828/2604_1 /TAXON_ID=374046 /ORGANISM="Helicotheca tamensis, Strain CCMP826" /LENGTH=172 /DNA_ID=CAMNT_0028395117 /DNA_START=156 /DNA_END=674 /DNA_ORIENTATION=+
MLRRGSAYFRGRGSVYVVEEARGGMPYKIVCLGLASIFVIFGIRDIFWCGRPLTNDPLEAQLISPFKDCQEEIYQEGCSGVIGANHLLVALIRYNAAMTEHTADLFKTMLLVVYIDAIYCFLMFRGGFEAIPMLYAGVVLLGLFYESYVLVIARKAYKAREKLKALKGNHEE